MIEYKPMAYTEFDCVGLYKTTISWGKTARMAHISGVAKVGFEPTT
jgi:hypothetical protein